jgi:hypothetical protein
MQVCNHQIHKDKSKKVRLTGKLASKREMGHMKREILLHILEGEDPYLNEFSVC